MYFIDVPIPYLALLCLLDWCCSSVPGIAWEDKCFKVLMNCCFRVLGFSQDSSENHCSMTETSVTVNNNTLPDLTCSAPLSFSGIEKNKALRMGRRVMMTIMKEAMKTWT